MKIKINCNKCRRERDYDVRKIKDGDTVVVDLRHCACQKIDFKALLNYENDVLELIDQVPDFTRSDLQGVVAVLVNKIYSHT